MINEVKINQREIKTIVFRFEKFDIKEFYSCRLHFNIILISIKIKRDITSEKTNEILNRIEKLKKNFSLYVKRIYIYFSFYLNLKSKKIYYGYSIPIKPNNTTLRI